MVAILVLATFATFILIDVLLHREKYRFRVAEVPRAATPASAPVVAGITLPKPLHYHPGHSWALHLGHGRIRVGLDEFAASLLGRIERVEVPPRGRWVRQGEKGWTIQTAHGLAAMLAPVEGEIVAVNDKLAQDPSLALKDPYHGGWLLEVFSPDVEVSLRNLLTGALARRWMEWAVAELRQALSPAAMVTALDGGLVRRELGAELPPAQWRELTARFFLC